MTVYRYVAKRSPIERETGRIEARSSPEALHQLAARGLAVLRLDRVDAAAGSEAGVRGTVPAVETANALRQIADLLEAGVPLLKAVRLTRAQTKRPVLANALETTAKALGEGLSLSAGLSRNPALFRPIVLALVRAGEAAGAVAPALRRIADQAERDEELRSRVRAALVYPAFVVSVGLLTSGFLVVFVVPRLAEMLADSGQTLPGPTRLLIGLSELTRRPSVGLAALGATAVLAFALRGGLFRPLREGWVHGTQRLPVWGNICRQQALARTTGALAALLEGGVPIIDALKHTIEIAGIDEYRNALRYVIGRVEQGTTLSVALNETNAFPTVLGQMVAVGEEGDGLVPALNKISVTFERSAERSLKMLSAILEPLLILAVGGFTAFLVAALLLPVFEVTAYVR